MPSKMTKEELQKIPVSWISGITSKKVVHQPLCEALAAIREGAQKDKILRMRSVVETNHEEYDRIKGTLPANVFSGKFVGGHAATDIAEYNRLMTLDIDKLDAERMAQVRQNLMDDEYVFAFWQSPSGKGYKGLVLLDYGDIDLVDKIYWHREAFNQLFKYIQTKYGFDLDTKCKDVPRLCFVSYDPCLVVKDKVTSFKVEPIEEVVKAVKVAEKHRKAFAGYKGNGTYNRIKPGRNQQKDRDTVSSIVKFLEKHKISITPNYNDFPVEIQIIMDLDFIG